MSDEPGTKYHAYRGSPCVPGADPRQCPGCHPAHEPPQDGDVRWKPGYLELESFDGQEWQPLRRLPSI